MKSKNDPIILELCVASSSSMFVDEVQTMFRRCPDRCGYFDAGSNLIRKNAANRLIT